MYVDIIILNIFNLNKLFFLFQCVLYRTHAVHGQCALYRTHAEVIMCYTERMQWSVCAIPNVCRGQCVLYRTHAAVSVCYTKRSACILKVFQC